ncbi:hypothetical protein PHLGIDRAFT_279006 [Phlebiopsis gigantea 11061_1 CR5-6]|uniref:Uncharacterized protein n=1 Tax=Phlebiopsis gigantea (strain 11061_1 CR5-6) TaxID=745531 RepID=A0A0C3NDV8_PHLG1|nr:hypothetical protein PHLGIDRAFT_279006 [Phlebiopsis gigantea 11061_1 CR5-6]
MACSSRKNQNVSPRGWCTKWRHGGEPFRLSTELYRALTRRRSRKAHMLRGTAQSKAIKNTASCSIAARSFARVVGLDVCARDPRLVVLTSGATRTL